MTERDNDGATPMHFAAARGKSYTGARRDVVDIVG